MDVYLDQQRKVIQDRDADSGSQHLSSEKLTIPPFGISYWMPSSLQVHSSYNIFHSIFKLLSTYLTFNLYGGSYYVA